MGPTEIIAILKDAIYVLIIIAAPPMVVALSVGLVISLLQALTQIQEQTLTFVPRILALLFTLMLTFPYIFDTLGTFGEGLYTRIATIE